MVWETMATMIDYWKEYSSQAHQIFSKVWEHSGTIISYKLLLDGISRHISKLSENRQVNPSNPLDIMNCYVGRVVKNYENYWVHPFVLEERRKFRSQTADNMDK
jgi:hypothetical protein